MAWLWGSLTSTGLHWNVWSCDAERKRPRWQQKKLVVPVVFSTFPFSIDFLSGELLFSKATNPIVGCFPISKEYFLIYLELSSLLRCWECKSSARPGTLWGLTLLNSMPCHWCHFSIGPRTDQWLLHINTILNLKLTLPPPGQLVV